MKYEGEYDQDQASPGQIACRKFVGTFHWFNWDRRVEFFGEGIRVRTQSTLSSYDGDELTRLVLGAHKFGIRVQVSPCNFNLMYIAFRQRERDRDKVKSLWEYHPNLQEALNASGYGDIDQ